MRKRERSRIAKEEVVNPARSTSPDPTVPRWLVPAGFIVGVLAVFVVLALVIWVPQPTDDQFTVFKIVIALGAAGFAMSLTGFISMRLGGERGNHLVAGGPLGVFVVVFFFTPAGKIVTSPGEACHMVAGGLAEPSVETFLKLGKHNDPQACLQKATEECDQYLSRAASHGYAASPNSVTCLAWYKLRSGKQDLPVTISAGLSKLLSPAQRQDDHSASPQHIERPPPPPIEPKKRISGRETVPTSAPMVAARVQSLPASTSRDDVGGVRLAQAVQPGEDKKELGTSKRSDMTVPAPDAVPLTHPDENTEITDSFSSLEFEALKTKKSTEDAACVAARALLSTRLRQKCEARGGILKFEPVEIIARKRKCTDCADVTLSHESSRSFICGAEGSADCLIVANARPRN